MPNNYSRRVYGSDRARFQLRLIEEDALAGEAGQVFQNIAASITSDLGGASELTEMQKHLITSFAGAALLQGRQLSKILQGQPLNPHEYTSVGLTMWRAARLLGVRRRAKELSSTLAPLEYARVRAEEAAE